MSISLSAEGGERRRVAESTVFSILLALGFSHFLNDMMGSLLPALYPMLKDTYGLSFTQIGMITLTSQLISSLLQPAKSAAANSAAEAMSARINDWPINAKLHTQRANLAPQISVDALKPLNKILSLKPPPPQAEAGATALAAQKASKIKFVSPA